MHGANTRWGGFPAGEHAFDALAPAPARFPVCVCVCTPAPEAEIYYAELPQFHEGPLHKTVMLVGPRRTPNGGSPYCGAGA